MTAADDLVQAFGQIARAHHEAFAAVDGVDEVTAELVEARGRATVPVLRSEGADGKVRWMPESRDIVRYLRDRAAPKA